MFGQRVSVFWFMRNANATAKLAPTHHFQPSLPLPGGEEKQHFITCPPHTACICWWESTSLTLATMSRCSWELLKFWAKSSMQRFWCWQVYTQALYSSGFGTLSRKIRNASQMASWQTEDKWFLVTKIHSFIFFSSFFFLVHVGVACFKII